MNWPSGWVQAENGQHLLYKHIHGQLRVGKKKSAPHGRALNRDRIPPSVQRAKRYLQHTEIKAECLHYFNLTFLHFNG